jgi:hypothetical protein
LKIYYNDKKFIIQIGNCMIKKFLIFPLFAFSAIFAKENVSFEKSDNNKSKYVIDKDQGLSKPIYKLMELLNIDITGDIEIDLQKIKTSWERTKERWDLKEIFQNEKDRALEIFDELNILNEVYPKLNKYDHVIIIGATIPSVRSRLSFLKEQSEKGIRFDSIVFLGGQRQLRASEIESLYDDNNPYISFKKDWKRSNTIPTTESEMMKIVFEQSELPNEMRNVKIVFVDAPMIIENEKLIRPGSKETINCWLKTSPKHGKCLVISNQPYVGFHEAIFKNAMPDDFVVEVIGKKANLNTIVPVFLDTIAKWASNEYIKLKK